MKLRHLFAFIAILSAFALFIGARKDKDQKLVVVFYDGGRWQETFNGADPSQIDSATAKYPAQTARKYVKGSAEANRAALMPFAWDYIYRNGLMIGNRQKGSGMEVTNRYKFSYPGYSESMCGFADDERINSNDDVDNPDRNVLEAVNADPRYHGSVEAFASWRAMSFILNEKRGGFEVNCGTDHFSRSGKRSEGEKELDEICDGLGYTAGTMPDVFVAKYALEAMKSSHPKVVFIAFDGPDHFPHLGQYDNYLGALNSADRYVSEIWEYCQKDPFYKGKTTLLVTADHGRGSGDKWRHHGEAPQSEQTWLMAVGPGVPALGEVSGSKTYTNSQIAPTIAKILGVNFTPDNGKDPGPVDLLFRK